MVKARPNRNFLSFVSLVTLILFLLGCGNKVDTENVTAENIKMISAGMSIKEVTDILGTPSPRMINKENAPPIGQFTIYAYKGRKDSGEVWFINGKVNGVKLNGKQIVSGPTINLDF
ncbi:hypothetical protein BVX98_05855 [bacterium F11]|nr:hypothetical protein BVX98_05855 [bacterium F11]